MSANRQGIRKMINRETGMVSIMVTLILMIVISLLVVGFAQISRRNARQALDQQLSTQAFYAAETGVNDATRLIRNAIQEGNQVPAKDTCEISGSFYNSLQPVLDDDANVEYTCLMVDPAPPTLRFGDVGTTSVVVPLTPESGNLNTVTFTWQTKDETSTPLDDCPSSATNAFSPHDEWEDCGYGVLRFDLVPTDGTFNAATLQDRTMTSFLVPVEGGESSIAFATGSSNANNRVATDCTNTECQMTVTGLSASQYYARVSSLYKNVSLQINATNASGPVGLVGAQAVVDATGKAQDVLRRIQVHVPLTASSNNQLSDHAIRSADSLCKRFSAMSGRFVNHTGIAGANRLCNDV